MVTRSDPNHCDRPRNSRWDWAACLLPVLLLWNNAPVHPNLHHTCRHVTLRHPIFVIFDFLLGVLYLHTNFVAIWPHLSWFPVPLLVDTQTCHASSIWRKLLSSFRLGTPSLWPSHLGLHEFGIWHVSHVRHHARNEHERKYVKLAIIRIQLVRSYMCMIYIYMMLPFDNLYRI